MTNDINTEAQFLGELPPLLIRKHSKRPEKRQISKRWLFSSVLVGTTSLILMGGALFAALEGREQLTLPAQAYERTNDTEGLGISQALKGHHPGFFAKLQQETPSNVMMVSTMSTEGGRNIVKEKPFMSIKSPMALAGRRNFKYTAFNPLNVFSQSKDDTIVSETSESIYGADVEGELELSVIPFPFEEVSTKLKPRQTSVQIRQQIQAIASNLYDQATITSALAFFDADRFSAESKTFITTEDVTITAENVSVIGRTNNSGEFEVYYEERTIEVRADTTISEVFLSEGLGATEVSELEAAISSDLGTTKLRKGDTLDTWFKHQRQLGGDAIKELARVSVFRGPAHLVSIARTDQDQLVYAIQPESPEEIFQQQENEPLLSGNNLPSVYDGIYRTAMAEGLSENLTQQLVKIFAFDVDFKSRITPQDRLEVFLSLEDGQDKPTDESKILYAGITLGNLKRSYYRFRDEETGIVDYYDEAGKSAKKFLLRKPVPNGRFRSGYGMRKHPISRRLKLHAGVDWSAPRGTPILSAGNGVVQKVGWSGGYGKQTIIRHANGYRTSYSHQTAYARGIRPGARVRQGQVIGYIGSTGYSTGPHLHYEVIVNGNRVDPMRIRLPKGKVLKGEELQLFEAERDRINALVNEGEETLVAVN
ncbi:MAG: M23 family metallopeptidase [Pseudomonadota bacterium]